MPIRLCRIDDRLIHGQVVLGWARALGIGDIVLVDDDVAASGWEQDLYRMAVPPELKVEFVDVEQARRRLPEWESGPMAVLILTGKIETMARLLADVLALFRALPIKALAIPYLPCVSMRLSIPKPLLLALAAE